MAMETIKLGGFVDEEVAKINANFAAVPTKTSELTNDSGFVTNTAIPSVPTKTSDLTNDSGFITSAAIPTNVSALNNDAGYITSAAIPSVPTKTSDLTNDSGFVTSAAIPTVPTNVSAFNNDANYVKTTDTAFTNKVDKEAGKGLLENNYTTAEKNKLAGLSAPAQVSFTAADFGNADANGYVSATKAITSGTPIAVFRANGANYERVLAGLDIAGGNVVITASEAFAGYVLCI